jgi:putative DNA primase/helicase
VGLDSFRSAARIAEWHLNEARRFFGGLALPAGLADAARLESWLVDRCRKNGSNEVPTKDVQQFGPSGLREKAKIDAAMMELEELGVVANEVVQP